LFCKRQLWLDSHGNHYHLTAFSYYILKLIPAIVFLIVSQYFRLAPVFTILIFLLIFFFIDINYIFKDYQDRNEIRSELPNIFTPLILYSYSKIPFEEVLLSIHKKIKNKRLHDAVVEMAAEIITTRDLKAALRHFESKFNMQEIYSFTFCIEQDRDTGKTRDMLISKRNFLNNNYLYKKDAQTSRNEIKVMVIMALNIIITAILVAYSFLYNIIDSVNVLIK
jgi:hypothetical protein